MIYDPDETVFDNFLNVIKKRKDVYIIKSFSKDDSIMKDIVDCMKKGHHLILTSAEAFYTPLENILQMGRYCEGLKTGEL